MLTSTTTLVRGLDIADPELAANVADGLTRIDELIRRELGNGDTIIRDAVVHLFEAGGKRFRPLFTVLSAQMGPRPDAWEVIVAGAVSELVHLATLYHDDVMDEAQIRRGQPTANVRWGNCQAILAGDYLFAAASELGWQLGLDAVRIVAKTSAQLITGQMRETRGPAPGTDPVEHYLRVIEEKTSSLIATAGRFGATFSGADALQTERLGRVGSCIGAAFQISDDIIDIHGALDEAGKVPGTDLREGVRTLPVLLALRESGPQADRLRELLTGPVSNDDDLAEALWLLRSSPGMAQARKMVDHYADAARGELAEFRHSPGREALLSLVDFTAHRRQ
ncbi:polyprenyl synthetase family protein [Mycobacterium sp. 852002-40037_SCH5390672]|uniref:polyprenyl synthetase family protein n=1 Tax=Mycobacterium sp. 852002-40037_SCH5390672 TaxID=1834089 RepID=UPI000804E620|nr:polyprenyl synthetase family protein [Mycobacterium sp. 852002-40037_SCH5390672]OBB89956.1 geranylgeranyl pyrophosphate synthase [Mycobacterium sp. 852002-40037_SCH5390672]